MTDQQKIARIVEFMGGWPEHKLIHPYVDGTAGSLTICTRCQGEILSPSCGEWNPFTRIEDAMVVVGSLQKDRLLYLNFLNEMDDMCGQERDTFYWFMDLPDPARAITEAAWQVIEKL